ncbi:MAG: hypothetical protein P8K82_10470 [Paracoccaceae bacterium]|nr:hypothetical protein [Paracoccaceae bacterium]
MKIGILPLARATFDVTLAEEKLQLMLAALDRSSHQILGPRSLLFDAETATAAMEDLKSEGIDHLLILQVTFTDAALTVTAATTFQEPLSIWAIKEMRAGGRLRLNSFCGLNLASHALALRRREFSWLYEDPNDGIDPQLDALFSGNRRAGNLHAKASDPYASDQGQSIAENLTSRRIAKIGAYPDGFDTCAYSAAELSNLSGVTVDALELDDLFKTAATASTDETKAARDIAQASMSDLDDVDQHQLDKSLRLKAGLDRLRSKGHYDAFAIRCWPETFTEYGGAVCGPAGMMSESGVPCACEADVYGALTQLILQEASGEAVFLTDLVDIDPEDNSAVVWHCGQAPISMRDPEVAASATIHTNRKMPLLYEFPLKPGAVTFVRISQSFNQPKMILAAGEMLKRPMAFTGTSGVVRFEKPADEVLSNVMDSGLEHHMALAYGEHRPALRAAAAAMNLPILEI